MLLYVEEDPRSDNFALKIDERLDPVRGWPDYLTREGLLRLTKFCIL